MNEPRSAFLRALTARGFVHQCTDLGGLDGLAVRPPLVAYIGFDCTAPSLHVGSLVSIMLLRWLQRTGHKPIVLMGGGTTKVGDPSGRDETRQLLTADDIAHNMAGIESVFSRYLEFGDGPTDALMVDNTEWLDKLNYIEFLRDYGGHFSINRMLGFESVKLRLEREQTLSFLEFNYMVLQAYDFVELNRHHGCVLQMGGSDQWGNIVNGVDLGRRADGATLYGLTTPLVATASGAKMGKTAEGAVWLDAGMYSPYDFWQYWRNTDDADVGRYLRLFTELPLDEIDRLGRLAGAEANEAKKVLADEATKLCHGEETAADAATTAASVFGEGGVGVIATPGTDEGTEVKDAATGLPLTVIAMNDLEKGIPAFELFRQVGLSPSRAEARKLIRGGGARINGAVVTNEMQEVTAADLKDADGVIKLSAGRKRHALVRATL